MPLCWNELVVDIHSQRERWELAQPAYSCTVAGSTAELIALTSAITPDYTAQARHWAEPPLKLGGGMTPRTGKVWQKGGMGEGGGVVLCCAVTHLYGWCRGRCGERWDRKKKMQRLGREAGSSHYFHTWATSVNEGLTEPDEPLYLGRERFD